MAYHRLLVQKMAAPDLIPPPDLITRLHFVHDKKFPRLMLTEDSLDLMLDLVSRPATVRYVDVTEKWAGGVANILNHYVRRQLPIAKPRRRWIAALIRCRLDVRELVASTSSPELVTKRGLTCLISLPKDSSVWSCALQLLKIKRGSQLGAFVFACSVQLLTLHRRAGLPLASELFNAMLGVEDGARMLSCTPEWRHHIALHGKIMCCS